MKVSLTRDNHFIEELKKNEIGFKREQINTLQLNITRRCNQACIHCHVNASPARREEMPLEVIDRILSLLDRDSLIKTVDITGGAPELHPNFRYLIRELKKRDKDIIDRCNLTVLLETGQEDTADFLAENNITVIASLPCYLEENVDYQRGNSTYKKSIKVLKQLNELGYGKAGSGLLLNLVYNPGGAFLPGAQKELEADYKRVLREEHGITFNRLLTIANMPINRYAEFLNQKGQYTDYCNLLVSSFNPDAADKIMCKSQISVGWDGVLYDCDFNQALGISVLSDRNTILELDRFSDITKSICFGSHCYGCTAGCGSSCQGSLT
jgi:radical SAM/Cys-rich protein